jgi:hypothetical protein
MSERLRLAHASQIFQGRADLLVDHPFRNIFRQVSHPEPNLAIVVANSCLFRHALTLAREFGDRQPSVAAVQRKN